MTEKDIITGVVKGLTNFGAFAELSDGRKGLVHISEISNKYVNNVEEYLEEGQEIKVVILDDSSEKLKLSIKKAMEITGEELPRREIKKPSKPFREKIRSKPFDPSTPPADFFEGRDTSENRSFDEIMSGYMKAAEERLSDAKKQRENKRGGGYVRKG